MRHKALEHARWRKLEMSAAASRACSRLRAPFLECRDLPKFLISARALTSSLKEDIEKM